MHLGLPAVPGPVLARRLRALVLEHAQTEHRRSFEPTLNLAAADDDLGPPRATRVRCALAWDDQLDDALRTDMTAALLRRLDHLDPTISLIAWLTRAGDLDTQDLDLATFRALNTAAAEAHAPDFHFVVVNRRAWRDPITGSGREWKRLRDRSSEQHNQCP